MASVKGRPAGPGRPKKRHNYSDKFKSSMEKALQKKAKDTGKSIFDIFCDMLWTVDKKTASAWSANFKSLVEIMVAKESHQVVEKHDAGPRIGLPPIKKPDEDTIVPANPNRGYVN
jgi:hypothetical protein